MDGETEAGFPDLIAFVHRGKSMGSYVWVSYMTGGGGETYGEE